MFGRKCLLLIAALMVGCGGGGGGGGGGGSGLSFTLSPGSLSGAYNPSQLPASFLVTATFHGSTSATTIYALIVDSSETFQVGQVNVTQTGPNTFATTLTTNQHMAPGAHTGTLTVRICTDLACNTQLASRVLPYSITVNPPTFGSLNATPYTHSAGQGGRLKVRVLMDNSGIWPLYFDVVDSAGVFSASDLRLGGNAPGVYDVLLPVPADLSATAHSGTLTVTVCDDAACQTVYGSDTLPYTVQVFGVLAGVPGSAGQADGPAATALFSSPRSIEVDGAGNVFVGEDATDDIRKITPEGVVSTVYTRSDVNYMSPGALVTDGDGNLYFTSDVGYNTDKLTPGGVLSHFSEFNGADLARDAAGNTWLARYSHGQVALIAPDGSYLSGFPVSYPRAIVVDAGGTAYIATGNKIVKRTSDGTVTDFVTAGANLVDLDFDVAGNLYVLDASRNVHKVAPDGATALWLAQYTEIVDPQAYATHPASVAIGPGGKLVMGDTYNNVVLYTTLP